MQHLDTQTNSSADTKSCKDDLNIEYVGELKIGSDRDLNIGSATEGEFIMAKLESQSKFSNLIIEIYIGELYFSLTFEVKTYLILKSGLIIKINSHLLMLLNMVRLIHGNIAPVCDNRLAK
jgi:hypothetical protein